MFMQMLNSCLSASQKADVIIYHPKVYIATDIAEATNAMPVVAAPVPVFPTSVFPSILFTINFGNSINRLSWSVFKASRLFFSSSINQWRRETLGLARAPLFSDIGQTSSGMALLLCCVSPSVINKPIDWDARTYMTGYWFLDEGVQWKPEQKLRDFLDHDAKPIFISFGSMTIKHARALTYSVIEAVSKAGERAILATGWGGMRNITAPDNICIIEQAPHSAIFELVKAVVHHGGAGTTAAGLKAGLPTLVCPGSIDQPFWGDRVYKLGCGPRPLTIKSISSENLAKRIRELCSKSEFKLNARSVSKLINREDRIANAISIIEKELIQN